MDAEIPKCMGRRHVPKMGEKKIGPFLVFLGGKQGW